MTSVYFNISKQPIKFRFLCDVILFKVVQDQDTDRKWQCHFLDRMTGIEMCIAKQEHALRFITLKNGQAAGHGLL